MLLLVRVVNQINTANNDSGATKGRVFNKNKSWGWTEFIKRDCLIDTSNGFIKNDTIIIEASLDIYAKQETTMMK